VSDNKSYLMFQTIHGKHWFDLDQTKAIMDFVQNNMSSTILDIWWGRDEGGSALQTLNELRQIRYCLCMDMLKYDIPEAGHYFWDDYSEAIKNMEINESLDHNLPCLLWDRTIQIKVF